MPLHCVDTQPLGKPTRARAYLNAGQWPRSGRVVDGLSNAGVAQARKGADVACLHPLHWDSREVVVHKQLADLAWTRRLIVCMPQDCSVSIRSCPTKDVEPGTDDGVLPERRARVCCLAMHAACVH